MRAQLVQADTRRTSSGAGRSLLLALGGFAFGFGTLGALVAIPRLWPRYVQVPIVANAKPVQLREAGLAGPDSLSPIHAAPDDPVPGIVTRIHTASPPIVQTIGPQTARSPVAR